MKKLLTAVLILLVIVAGGLFFFTSRLDGVVAGIIENQGSSVTQTPVTVGGVSIKLVDATASISRLAVGNPKGFSGNAIEMDNFAIALDPSTLTGDIIVIKSVAVQGARVNLQQSGTRLNLRELLNSLPDEDGADSAPGDSGGKKVVIERFTLDGASAMVDLPDVGERREVELPKIVVRDIGRATHGATGAEVAEQILRPVLERALDSSVTQSVKDKVREKLGATTGGLLENLGDAMRDKDPE
jgi:hypothetical protein